MLVNVMRPVIGLDPNLEAEFRSALGKRCRFLVPAAGLIDGPIDEPLRRLNGTRP
jgi:hypothetical protein